MRLLASSHALVFALLLTLPARAGDEPTPPRDVSALLAPVRADSDVPGLVAAVVRGKDLVAIGAAGVRKRGDETPLTTSDKMHLGSCTKAMTATLAALFVEEGKLQWTTRLGEVCPRESMLPAWRDVTLEQLLTNRGGASASLDADGLWQKLWAHTGTPLEQRETLLLGVTKREPEYTPGSKFVYSNTNFALAGHMLETLAKKPWEELIQERLFRPLGITTAGFGAPGTKGKLGQPLGHRGKTPVEVGPGSDNPAAIGPAGTVHMSIGDWAKFVAVHLRGEADGCDATQPALGRETFVKLHAAVADDKTHYAMGWAIEEQPWTNGRALMHNGSNTMWYCVTWLAPNADIAVLAACNVGGEAGAKACDHAVSALLKDDLAAREAKAK